MTRERRKSNISRDRWLVSYADFITLLFALFVVLFAFAKADHQNQAQVSTAIDSAFRSLGLFPDAASWSAKKSGVNPTTEPLSIVMSEDVLSPAHVRDNLEHLHRELSTPIMTRLSFSFLFSEGYMISRRRFLEVGGVGTVAALSPLAALGLVQNGKSNETP